MLVKILVVFLLFIGVAHAQNYGIYPVKQSVQSSLNLAPIVSFVRQLQTSVNYYSGLMYQLDGTIANQAVLSAINRNMTLVKNNVRSLEGFMFNLDSGKVTSSNLKSSFSPLPDSRSVIGNPPAAASLVNSGRLQTNQLRVWLLKCSDFLQTTLKSLSM